MNYTRRDFTKVMLAGIPAVAWADSKPDSKWAGVQVGMNVPYNFGPGNFTPADDVLQKCIALGVSAVELRAQPVELFLGAVREATPDERRRWRKGVSLDKVRDLRRTYEDAGVLIEVVKWDGIYAMSDDEVDYVFQVSKTLGAKAISTEISVDGTKRIGQFADRHQLPVGYHGHAETSAAMFETAFSQAKCNFANLDLGHFTAGQNTSPVPFLTRHHTRITHVHIKDRKFNNGPNVPFGQGDTPIREVLQLMRDRRWPFQATVEFEYPVPAGSDRTAELARCMEFCRNCLLG
ncbi:MAG: sugar phosphate isomerase/epimerase [Acidobacteria bacterium]|nr:sugar phosphate isomerase/epimerase [Acidobacteriota bacterium]